jgi:uncharacterized protein YodC (DUF2158 family)
MAQIFKKGDIVSLKSGGPKMTVETYRWEMVTMTSSKESDHIVTCTWFDNSNKLVSHDFEQDSLRLNEE